MSDICPHCDGSGERDFLSGAKCYECDGTGWKEDSDPDEDEWDHGEFEEEMREFLDDEGRGTTWN